MRNKKIYYRLETDFDIATKKGYGYGDRYGSGDGYGDSGSWDGNGYGLFHRNGDGWGDEDRTRQGHGLGSFIIEEDEE